MAALNPWDERFARDEAFYGLAPSPFVMDCAAAIPPGGRVLCLAEGQGRHALALSARGYNVSAMDLSAVACAQLRQRAESLRLPLTVVQQDLGLWSPPEGRYNGIVAVYAHMPRALRQGLHRQVVRALAPGGLFIVEGFRVEQCGRPSGGPPTPDWLYSEEELRGDFAALTIEHLSTPEVALEEGRGHRGSGALIRLRARRAGNL